MIRQIIGVVAGYAVFVATSLILFKVSGRDPHSDPTLTFVLLTLVYGVAFSFTAGFITQIIARTRNVKINYILALIIAGFAMFSFFKSEGNHWTQLLAFFIFAPVSILGGLFYNKRQKRDTESD